MVAEPHVPADARRVPDGERDRAKTDAMISIDSGTSDIYFGRNIRLDQHDALAGAPFIRDRGDPGARQCGGSEVRIMFAAENSAGPPHGTSRN
jgi:hypothetical protein